MIRGATTLMASNSAGSWERGWDRENAMLSHDLFEGLYARCALVSDVELVDDFPSTVLAHARRKHRWVRGDWQVLMCVLPVMPTSHGLARTNLPLRNVLFVAVVASIGIPNVIIGIAWDLVLNPANGLFNIFLRPLLILLTFTVTLLTLGLFLFVINALLFWAAASLLDVFQVRVFAAALLGSLIYSVFSLVIDSALERLFPQQ